MSIINDTTPRLTRHLSDHHAVQGEAEYVERHAPATASPDWQPIETAPHEELLVLGWHENGVWKQEIALASAGNRYPNGYSDRWQHGRATHWMPLPAAPDTTDNCRTPPRPSETVAEALREIRAAVQDANLSKGVRLDIIDKIALRVLKGADQ